MRSRRRPLRARRSIWLRIVAAFLLAVVTSWTTLAWAIRCCGHDDRCGDEQVTTQGSGARGEAAPGERDVASGHHDDPATEEPCSCPSGSSPCCGDIALPALLPPVTPGLSAPLLWIDLALPDLTQLPPDGGAEDVFHVPRTPLAALV